MGESGPSVGKANTSSSMSESGGFSGVWSSAVLGEEGSPFFFSAIQGRQDSSFSEDIGKDLLFCLAGEKRFPKHLATEFLRAGVFWGVRRAFS